ncbi:putative quinol monooxygenase [Bifidobacterium pseudolongum]|uniref:putative quinol monooxygenase n=1 Tax=Bifidobacterium pseudolongum TaxID=1694 RepID=UPI0039946056
MAITINVRYTGTGGQARAFARKMASSGTVSMIREEPGNLRYEYYVSLEDPETVLLVDSWTGQDALDAHHASPMMERIARLRDQYDLHMSVERFRALPTTPLTRDSSDGDRIYVLSAGQGLQMARDGGMAWRI